MLYAGKSSEWLEDDNENADIIIGTGNRLERNIQ